jgi:hypothetical protein
MSNNNNKNSQQQTSPHCDTHGEFTENVKNMREDMRELKKVHEDSQKEIILKIDNNHKAVLDKIEILIDRRFDDYRRCEEHRVGIMEQVDIKLDEALHPLVSSMADNVKSNTKFRVEFKYYLLAVATLAGFLKFFT